MITTRERGQEFSGNSKFCFSRILQMLKVWVDLIPSRAHRLGFAKLLPGQEPVSHWFLKAIYFLLFLFKTCFMVTYTATGHWFTLMLGSSKYRMPRCFFNLAPETCEGCPQALRNKLTPSSLASHADQTLWVTLDIQIGIASLRKFTLVLVCHGSLISPALTSVIPRQRFKYSRYRKF